ncbi:MAG TPA: hypothetical protein PLX54_10415 [Candidatus Fermentibacter daniensis]|nr:hypothetical protein [Candidatus Fermentibacter daniensis]HOR07476.1 hypothetical protein [Candidatus Fermentibacter daniensis]HPK52757.1 hypothetical protein [Candidatus Fermentibacter daniensis]
MARKQSVIDAPSDASSTPDEESPPSTVLCGEKWISRKEARNILGTSSDQIPDKLLDEFLNHILLIAQTSVDLNNDSQLSSKKRTAKKRGTPRKRKHTRVSLSKSI